MSTHHQVDHQISALSQDESSKRLSVAVFGASGYSGSELLGILNNHAYFTVKYAFSSARSATQSWLSLAPQLAGTSTLEIQPWLSTKFAEVAAECAAVFLALPHEASAELGAKFYAAGVSVFDLSGAYRFANAEQFATTYGFSHPHPELLNSASYMLMEWLTKTPTASHQAALCAIPGCYPTAATLALKPLTTNNLLNTKITPVITAISGVSGAGRGVNARTSFCEVSVQAYSVGNHRHTPEIANNLESNVVFTPQLGNYKRGIVATCVAKLAAGVSAEQVHAAFKQAYNNQPFVRIVAAAPAVDHVAHTPFCDIYVNVTGSQVVVISAIDNLLKGAAGQAIHAANAVFELPAREGFQQYFPHPAAKVIKIGGALLQPANRTALQTFLNALATAAQPCVLVHGGGALVDEMLAATGVTAEKVSGQRVSAAEHMDIIVGALAGTSNKRLVNAAIQQGLPAMGLSLADGPLWHMQSEPRLGKVGVPVQQGFSARGKALLNTLLRQGFMPIVSSIGSDEQGELCNVNADYAAAAIAMALDAELLLLSDVPAILDENGAAIGEVSLSAAQQLLAQPFVQGGMQVKLQAAILTSEFSRRTTAIASWADSQAVIAFLTESSTYSGTQIRP